MPTDIYVLPPKISGFHDRTSPAPKLWNLKPFQQCCQRVVQGGIFEVIHFFDFTQHPSKSYHFTLFVRGEQFYLVFVNKYYPYIAIAQVLVPISVVHDLVNELPVNQFVDVPALAKYFEGDFEVLPASFLERSPDADDPESAAIVKDLEKAEFAEFAYWEPRCIGEIIFNNWDKR